MVLPYYKEITTLYILLRPHTINISMYISISQSLIETLIFSGIQDIDYQGAFDSSDTALFREIPSFNTGVRLRRKPYQEKNSFLSLVRFFYIILHIL